MKKCAPILAVLLLFCAFSGCRKTEEPTDTVTKAALVSGPVQSQTEKAAETTQETTIKESEKHTEKPTGKTAETTTQKVTAAKKTEKPKISASDLFDANTITMLLNHYSCVRVIRTHDFGKQTEQYSLLDDEIMEIVKTSPNDGEPYYYGQYGAFYFEVENDRTKAYVMLDDLNRTVEFPREDTIANLFSGCKADYVKENEDCYILKVTYPDKDVDDYEVLVAVKKDTLAVVKAVYKSEGKITQTAKFALGAEVKDYAKIISKWNAKRKTVTVIAEKQQGNNKTVKQTELKLPSDWEITVNDSQELTAYMDSDCTVPYRYPGNGKSYKLYVTNSMG